MNTILMEISVPPTTAITTTPTASATSNLLLSTACARMSDSTVNNNNIDYSTLTSSIASMNDDWLTQTMFDEDFKSFCTDSSVQCVLSTPDPNRVLPMLYLDPQPVASSPAPGIGNNLEATAVASTNMTPGIVVPKKGSSKNNPNANATTKKAKAATIATAEMNTAVPTVPIVAPTSIKRPRAIMENDTATAVPLVPSSRSTSPTFSTSRTVSPSLESDNDDTSSSLNSSAEAGRNLTEKELLRMEKNKISARRSREKRRKEHDEMSHCVKSLESENIQLKAQLSEKEREVEFLRKLVLNFSSTGKFDLSF